MRRFLARGTWPTILISNFPWTPRSCATVIVAFTARAPSVWSASSPLLFFLRLNVPERRSMSTTKEFSAVRRAERQRSRRRWSSWQPSARDGEAGTDLLSLMRRGVRLHGTRLAAIHAGAVRRDHTNPSVRSEPSSDSPPTRALAEQSCFDRFLSTASIGGVRTDPPARSASSSQLFATARDSARPADDRKDAAHEIANTRA